MTRRWKPTVELFQADSATGFTVRLAGEGLSDASLSLFGAGRWPHIQLALDEDGDLSVLSPDGSNFVTAGDLGLALAFSLTGTLAPVVVEYSVP